MNNYKFRILSFVSVLIYTLSFIWGFKDWIAPTWGYLFSTKITDQNPIVSCLVFCLIPLFWMPVEHKRPTMLIYWMLYMLTYIPMIIGVSYGALFDNTQILAFNTSAALALYANGLCYKIRLRNLQFTYLRENFFWLVFTVLTSSLVIFVYIIFKGNFSLIDPFSTSLYDKREQGVSIEQGSYVGYAILWLAGACFPFLFACGYYYKKYHLIAISVLGQLFIYMTKADKAFIFSFGLLYLVAFLLYRTKYTGIFFASFIAFATTAVTYLMIETTEELAFLFFSTATTFLLRLTGVSAFTAEVYYRFFEDGNPYTYYSHLNVLQNFLKYPYPNPKIGETITGYYTNNPFNANANYFLTDGLIAVGVLGMPIAAVLCSIVFYVMDSAAKKHNIIFATLTMVYTGTNMMNVSIFTAFLSGGIFLLILFLSIFPPRESLS
jgi:hypothetical protein